MKSLSLYRNNLSIKALDGEAVLSRSCDTVPYHQLTSFTPGLPPVHESASNFGYLLYGPYLLFLIASFINN